MSDHADSDGQDSIDARAEQSARETVEAYETEDGVVFYDAQNPLAWLKTSRTLTLRDQI